MDDPADRSTVQSNSAQPHPGPASAEQTNNRWRPSKALWFGAALVAAVLFLQWPIFKGALYEAVGIETPTSTISWRGDFDAALAEAKASDKPVLLVFSASWCPPCNVMKREVWPDDEVEQSVSDRFVPLHIDVDHSPTVAARYGIRSIPAIVVADAKGNVLRQASYMTPAETLAFLAGSRD